MTSTFARILAELSEPTAYVGYGGMGSHEHTPFHLASLAECGSPDAADSPGATFLARVASDVAEYLTAGEGPNAEAVASLDDAAYEIADSAVPIYTHERWQVFVDLAAYNEDVTEYATGTPTDLADLTSLARIALYMIAERLVRALADELSEALDDACEECGVSLGEPTTVNEPADA